MAETATILIIDGLTGQETLRNLNKEELDELKTGLAAEQARQEAEEAKADAKTSALAKLAALGLTEEEIAAL
jgi:hypothetical protein